MEYQIPTWIVATALRTNMMMIGAINKTRAKIAIPKTSLLLASRKVLFT